MRKLLMLSLLLLVLLPAACTTPPLDDDDAAGLWVEYVVEPAPPRRDLLNACEWATVSAGFPPGSRDEGRGSVTSGWDVHLRPYSKKGLRWQGILKVVIREDGSTILKARVLTERNMEINETMNPAAAEWERTDDEPARARVLMQHVLSQLHISG
jgi:hypothetical protein